MDTVLPISATIAEPFATAALPTHDAPEAGALLMPADEARAAADRAAEWNSSLKPYNAFEVYLVDRMAVESFRIEGCEHHERHLRSRNAIRAKLRWDEDRRLAAEEMGAKLARDPARFVGRLQSTVQGCDWMIDRWGRLGRILEAKGAWNEAQTALALDLLGVPKDLRDETNPIDGDAEARREVVRAEVARITGLKAKGLDVLDRVERVAAESGFGPDHDGELAAVRRFERTCARRFEWARGQLKAGRHGYQPDGPAPRWIAPRPESPPPSPAPSPPVEEPSRVQPRAERPAAPIVAPAAPAPAKTVEVAQATPTTGLLRNLFATAVPTGNRHSRRAEAAAGRRNG